MTTLLGRLQGPKDYGGDLQCPHCHKFCDVEWTTEYGDPVDGDAQHPCPGCGVMIEFEVDTTTTYTPYNRKNRP